MRPFLFLQLLRLCHDGAGGNLAFKCPVLWDLASSLLHTYQFSKKIGEASSLEQAPQ